MKEKFRKDEEFLAYNKRNCLINLLQAENHIKAMNTLNFIKGEGSCVLKHLLFVKGELNEAISHASKIEPRSVKTFEKLHNKIENFFQKIEKKHNYKKRDLLILVRGWRKELEKTMPFYQTFNCKCLHFIPYAKILFVFLSGILFAYFLFWLLATLT